MKLTLTTKTSLVSKIIIILIAFFFCLPKVYAQGKITDMDYNHLKSVVGTM